MEIVVGAFPSLLRKLTDLIDGEYNLQKEVKGSIKFLHVELETMKVALEKISETPADKLDKQDKIWARDVRELSYDIEDKIDTFMVRSKAGSKVGEKDEQHGFKKAIDRSLNWLMWPNIRRKIAIDIRDIKNHVLEVHERRRRYEVNNHSVDKPVKVDPRTLVRYEEVRKLVGIDEARDEVIKILIQGDEVSKQQPDKIVSIVGFGGLGKTTVANVVYEKLREEFDCSAFVSVSQNPDEEKLLNNLLYQLSKGKNTNINNNVIIDELRKFLREKRYFIVIDDIWDISDWKYIRYALPHNNGGCKIITTTRIWRVAEEVGGAYKMKPLCLHSSRTLLYGRIFDHEGRDKCPNEELVEVSNKILTKCAGVPLAIITVASLLASKERNKLEWYEVCNSIGTGMENNIDVENMRNVLLLSYYHLIPRLRTCLLYLSVFPEDHEIDKRRLIWMWIAEGFIQCGKQGQNLFEVGECCFNELINRSMIQPVYYMDTMKVQSCRVHDVVLDLIRSLSSDENFATNLYDMGHASPSQKIRRLSLQNVKVNEGTHGANVSMQQVRSVAAFSSVVNLIPALSRFEVVRVLHLENCDLSHGYNLKYIGKLVHLRFLGLRSTKIVHLPEEIGSLQFLQVLDISNNEVSTLPLTIVQLRQLKCLYIDQKVTVEDRIGGLTSLEELRLDLNLPTIQDSNGTIQELGCLTKLRVLDITVYFGTKEKNMLVECLHKLQNIQNLSISFLGYTGNLDRWVGPQSLRSLEIDGDMFSRLPVWIKHSHVQNLSFLSISVEELQQQDLETLGRLPALRELHIRLARGRSSIYYGFSKFSGQFVISAGLFPWLLHCKFNGYYPRVAFQKGAMPSLKSLKLDLPRAVWSEWTEIPDLGFENLPSLLHLHVGLRCGQGSALADVARAALRNMTEVHPSHPSISATGYNF